MTEFRYTKVCNTCIHNYPSDYVYPERPPFGTAPCKKGIDRNYIFDRWSCFSDEYHYKITNLCGFYTCKPPLCDLDTFLRSLRRYKDRKAQLGLFE